MRKIPNSAVRRLVQYLHFLEEFAGAGVTTVSSAELARRGGTTSAQVRKDLSLFGSFGKRGLGYDVPGLARRLRRILGLDTRYTVAVVGAGRIGSALVQYEGFRRRGFTVVHVYDRDPAKIGDRWNGLVVADVAQLEDDLRESPVDIGIIVTPATAATEVLERLVRAGVRAILNFAPIQLTVPPGVELNNVNLALELETLSYALANE